MIVSSHNLDEIDRLTNTIFFMKDGQILQESLRDYTMKEYYLTVNDVEKAKRVLREHEINFHMTEEGQIVFQDKEVSAQQVILHLNGQDVFIEDLEVNRIGAEKRYLELFEGNVSS